MCGGGGRRWRCGRARLSDQINGGGWGAAVGVQTEIWLAGVLPDIAPESGMSQDWPLCLSHPAPQRHLRIRFR